MIKPILSNNGYTILKKNITPQKLDKLKLDLTVTPKTNQDYGDTPESFPVYTETKDSIIIPRYFGSKFYTTPTIKFDTKNSKVDFEFLGKLRGTQPEIAQFIIDRLKTQGGGLLQLHTGYGKTTVALYLASILKLKTLILVHKTFLQDQWYDRIKQFTTASIGMIRQKKVDVEGKDIVIGMLQSVSMIDYEPAIFKDFDLLISDECFPGYTRIITDKGSYTIAKLYQLWKNGNELPLIKSYNEKQKCFEFKKMTYAWEKHTDKLVKVTLNKKTIECTPNHRFLTINGYKEAQTLTNYDIVLGHFSENNTDFDYGMCCVTSVNEIEVNNSNQEVYDIEVEDNHNFIVIGDTDNYGPIVHNCHHMGSKVFSRALLKLCPKYTIGLSATPTRNDGLTKVIKWFLGETLVKVERKGDNAVYVKSFNYKSDDSLFSEKKRWIKGAAGAKPDTVKMITNMYKLNDRNKFITNIIDSLRRKDERKTLILSGRIEHLKVLKKLVDTKIEKDVVDGKCTSDEFKTSFYIGGMKDYELKDAAEADIIFATYSMAEEGLDIDGLNTLILATPKKNIIQSIGRIMRKPIEEGDVNPLVIDIIDDLSCFKTWGDQRLKYYKSKNYTVNNYKSFNDNLITFKEYMINEDIIKPADLNNPNLDMRKEYIVKKFGMITYDFEAQIDFDSFPSDMFEYECNYDKIFEIDHDYSNNANDNNDIKIEITFDPVIEIEI